MRFPLRRTHVKDYLLDTDIYKVYTIPLSKDYIWVNFGLIMCWKGSFLPSSHVIFAQTVLSWLPWQRFERNRLCFAWIDFLFKIWKSISFNLSVCFIHQILIVNKLCFWVSNIYVYTVAWKCAKTVVFTIESCNFCSRFVILVTMATVWKRLEMFCMSWFFHKNATIQ